MQHQQFVICYSVTPFYSAPQCSHCKRCTNYGDSVRPSVRHTPVLCQNDCTCSLHCKIAKCVRKSKMFVKDEAKVASRVSGVKCGVVTARRFANAVLAIRQFRLSVCLSVGPSVTRWYCVKTTARSTVQFALSDSKMCLSFVETKKYSPWTTLPPEILAPSDLPPPDSIES